jgi:hypothetical protein
MVSTRQVVAKWWQLRVTTRTPTRKLLISKAPAGVEPVTCSLRSLSKAKLRRTRTNYPGQKTEDSD